MFKAIGRWGSSVRSSINVHIFANIFGSKSKKYGDLGNEDEEIFIDALETIDHETDTEEGIDDHDTENIKSEIHDTKLDKTDGNESYAIDGLSGTNTTSSPYVTTKVEIVDTNDTEKEVTIEVSVQDTEQLSSHEESEKHSSNGSESGDTADEKSDSEHEGNDDTDDHVNHKDTKTIITNSKSNNGIVHSASSSSMMKKVHRRMNSYSQRQYAKFDNSQDDENDNVVHSVDVSPKDNEDIHQVDDDGIEQSQVLKTEKKTKRKKKVAFFNFFRGFFRSKSTRIR